MNLIALEKLEWLIGIYWYNEEADNLESLGINWSEYPTTKDLLRGLSRQGETRPLITIINAILANTQLQQDYQRNWNYNYVYVNKQVDGLLQSLKDDGFIISEFQVRLPQPNDAKAILSNSNEGVAPKMEVIPRFKARAFTSNDKMAFVLMPLREPFFSILKEHIKPVCEEFGLTAIHAGDVDEIEEIIENIWKSINQARLIIADLSTKNPNVFYELGMAHTVGKKVIMITQDDKDPFPFDIGGIKGIRYTYPSEMDVFHDKLRRILKNLLAETK